MKRFLLFLILSAVAAARTHKTFPATHQSVALENARADALGLDRFETEADVDAAIHCQVLEPLVGRFDPRLPVNRRYALPDTVAFVTTLNEEFAAVGGTLVIDSAVRPATLQKRLHRRLRNAAPATGERASSHERGTTVDFSRRMTRGQYRWLLARLGYYQALGRILVIEEKCCIHVFVGGEHARN